MKRLFLLPFLVFIFTNSYSQSTYKVLWLGNSYTGVNNLPALTKSVAQSVGDDIIYQSVTPGGARFLTHSPSGSTAMNTIFTDDWDYVTLQAQSLEGAYPGAPAIQLDSFVASHAKILCDSIRSNNGCTKPVFFMTWGRENGHASLCSSFRDYYCTYAGMDSALNVNYRYMAEQNKALVSPVGAVWHYLRDSFPTLDLYSPDESHPSTRGSYAAAVTFYTIFAQKDPALVTYDYSIGTTDANIIRNAVKAVVFDSLYKWNVGKYDPVRDSIVSDYDSLELNSTWYYSDTAFTDTLFGLSQYGCDSLVNYHLTIHNTIGIEDSTTNNDTTVIEGIMENGMSDIKIYPNPAKNVLHIASEKGMSKVLISDVFGQKKMEVLSGQQLISVDLKGMSRGVYVLQLHDDYGEVKIFRFLIDY